MTVLCRYHYDPLDRLASRTPRAQAIAQRFYKSGQLATELQGAKHRSFVRSGAQMLAQTSQSDTVLLGADQQNSVLQADDTAIAYAPYGHREDEPEIPGFNGEQPDPITGHYLLGHGYRAYNPLLMRFNSPDNLSPFAGGGLNAYSYCLGDPINRVDPSGHMSWQAGLGLGLSVFGIVASVLSFGAATPLAIAGLTTGIASGAAGVAQAVTEESSPQASSVLGWVSLGLGIASAGFGVAAGFQKVAGRIVDRLHVPLSGSGHNNGFIQIPPRRVPITQPVVTPLSRQEEAFRDVAQNMTGNQLLNFMELSDDARRAIPRHVRTSAVSGHADIFSPQAIYRLRNIALGRETGYLPSQVLNSVRLSTAAQALPQGGHFLEEFGQLAGYLFELEALGRL